MNALLQLSVHTCFKHTSFQTTSRQTLLWQILNLPCSRPQRQTISTVSKSPVTIGEWCKCKFFSAMVTSRKYCYELSSQGCKLAIELRRYAPYHLWPQPLALTPALLWRLWCPIADGSSLPVSHSGLSTLSTPTHNLVLHNICVTILIRILFRYIDYVILMEFWLNSFQHIFKWKISSRRSSYSKAKLVTYYMNACLTLRSNNHGYLIKSINIFFVVFLVGPSIIIYFKYYCFSIFSSNSYTSQKVVFVPNAWLITATNYHLQTPLLSLVVHLNTCSRMFRSSPIILIILIVYYDNMVYLK